MLGTLHPVAVYNMLLDGQSSQQPQNTSISFHVRDMKQPVHVEKERSGGGIQGRQLKTLTQAPRQRKKSRRYTLAAILLLKDYEAEGSSRSK